MGEYKLCYGNTAGKSSELRVTKHIVNGQNTQQRNETQPREEQPTGDEIEYCGA